MNANANGRPAEEPEIAAPESSRDRLHVLLGDRIKTVAMLGFCSVLSGFAEAGVLALLAEIASTAASHTGKGKTTQASTSIFHLHASVKDLFIIAFALTIIRVLLQAPLALLPARIGADVQARLRGKVFAAFTRASWTKQSLDREGLLQETMTSQVMQATMGAMAATSLVIAIFSFVVMMTFAIYLNAIAAIVILVAAILLFAALRPLNSLGQRRARELSAAQVAYAGGVSEASRLAEETHVHGVAAAQRERVGGLIARSQDLFYRSQIIARLAPAVYQSAIYLILVAGLAVLYAQGAQHFAALGAVILLIVRAGTYGQGVQSSYQGVRSSLPFIERVQDATQRYAASEPPDGRLQLQDVEGIAFEDVGFSYRPGRPVLSEINFDVTAGETVGVIGPSGAGKSTLIQLLLQLRAPGEGRYLVNGTPVEEFSRASWHERVSYVPQQPRLMHASVAENIRFFRDLPREQVEEAARLARIHEEIMTWPDGYDTTVGPRVDAVSGGQQQRICLARALASTPQMLVLDEPTSALDPGSESRIQESLMGLKRQLTLFIIAHRMSTLDICDRIMVILDGKLVAFDTIDHLERNNAYYQTASTLAAGASGGHLP